MYKNSVGRQDFRTSSNTNSGDDSAENIIKKYARPRRCNKTSFDSGNRPSNPFGNYYFAISADSNRKASSNKKITLDNHLYDFITNYCREEIKKEIDSKLAEKTLNSTVENNKCEEEPNTSKHGNDKEFTDKETTCQSFFNLYDQDFIHKTIERNARLRRLIRKLVTAHQKQMQNEAWNNFINELKNKHAPDNMPRRIKNSLPIEDNENLLEFIDDCYNTKFSCAHSNICENLLDDIYEVPYLSKFSSNCRRLSEDRQENNSFPSLSLARLALMQLKNRERTNSIGTRTYPDSIKFDQNIQRADNLVTRPIPNYGYSSTLCKLCMENSVQTDFDESPIDQTTTVTTKVSCMQDTYKVDLNLGDFSKRTQHGSLNRADIEDLTLKNIEDKLEKIMHSINNFMKELKSKKKLKTNRRTTNIHLICRECNDAKRDLLKKFNENVWFDSDKYNSSNSLLRTSDDADHANSDITKLNEIFSKQLDDSPYNRNKTCAVQFDFEVPTKERSTEVTKSLSATWTKTNNDVEEILVSSLQHNQQMTIAVNTDPLSFLALLKISTEAMKSLLAYVPSFDYYYYLSRLQFPQLTRSIECNNFVCNVCGANFENPSALNDHILDHSLGGNRNCSVCRHVLENLGRKSKLFSCRYCGQCFTRAYCCELHQETCSRHQHNSTEQDLLILR